ncbi:hypothetical protein XENORESO_018872 [Xenotaenia resolanae]|uniref:Uncharacterized protein n=1 Tax=Xenotaenia resolanae TaxID=208358 RepID=A0ABV0W866_9TELE
MKCILSSGKNPFSHLARLNITFLETAQIPTLAFFQAILQRDDKIFKYSFLCDSDFPSVQRSVTDMVDTLALSIETVLQQEYQRPKVFIREISGRHHRIVLWGKSTQ